MGALGSGVVDARLPVPVPLSLRGRVEVGQHERRGERVRRRVSSGVATLAPAAASGLDSAHDISCAIFVKSVKSSAERPAAL